MRIVILKSLIGSAVTALAVAGALLTAAPAVAEEPDDSFLGTLEMIGIPVASPGSAIAMAQGACEDLDGGAGVPAAVDTVAADGALGQEDAALFVGVSIGAYCPEHEALLG